MKIAICDDDKNIVKELKKYIQSFFKQKKHPYELYEFYNGETLIKTNIQFDLIFIDIEMPGINGLTVAKQLSQKNPDLITFVVTSFQYYLDDAMELNVYRYVVKPIDKIRFYKNLEFALKKFLLNNKYILFESNKMIHKIKASNIIFLNIEQRKVCVYTYDNVFISNEPIENWQKKLNFNFFARPHHSYIINMIYVINFSKDKILLKCKDKQYEAYISTRKYNEFKTTFFNFIGGVS